MPPLLVRRLEATARAAEFRAPSAEVLRALDRLGRAAAESIACGWRRPQPWCRNEMSQRKVGAWTAVGAIAILFGVVACSGSNGGSGADGGSGANGCAGLAACGPDLPAAHG